MQIEQAHISKTLENMGFPHDVADSIVTQYSQHDKIEKLLDYVNTKISILSELDSVPLQDR